MYRERIDRGEGKRPIILVGKDGHGLHVREDQKPRGPEDRFAHPMSNAVKHDLVKVGIFSARR